MTGMERYFPVKQDSFLLINDQWLAPISRLEYSVNYVTCSSVFWQSVLWSGHQNVHQWDNVVILTIIIAEKTIW